MEEFEEEIIDLEDNEDDNSDNNIQEIIDEESIVSQDNNRKKVDNLLDGAGSETLQKIGVPKKAADTAIKKNGGTFSPANMPGNKAINHQTRNQLAKNIPANDIDSKKIQSVLGKHPNTPNILNNQSFEQKNDNITNEIQQKSSTSGNALNNKVTDEVISSIINKPKKIKLYIIVALVSFVILLLLIIIIYLGGFSTDDELGENTNGYVTGQITEDELLDQLKYYGYCKDKRTCKQQGSYKFFEKLKSTYELTNKECTDNIKNDTPCGITLNTALIIETINYYDNATDNFDIYDRTDEEINVSSFISLIKKAFQDKKQLDNMLDDVDELVRAQSEYVKESCRYLTQAEKEKDLKDGKIDNAKNKYTNYYYQISFDKYISYLKYGTSSSHPNYQGKPVEIENEICQGQNDDYITTNYSNSTNSNLQIDTDTNQYSVIGSGKGVEIANYALQFVGNPYVYGGTDLIKGVDCSGFTMKVMEHFGINIPHQSSLQALYGINMGTNISNALPGDLIVYDGHVAIYIGNNSIVHASSPKTGIKVSSNASYRSIVAIVRLWN